MGFDFGLKAFLNFARTQPRLITSILQPQTPLRKASKQILQKKVATERARKEFSTQTWDIATVDVIGFWKPAYDLTNLWCTVFETLNLNRLVGKLCNPRSECSVFGDARFLICIGEFSFWMGIKGKISKSSLIGGIHHKTWQCASKPCSWESVLFH